MKNIKSNKLSIKKNPEKKEMAIFSLSKGTVIAYVITLLIFVIYGALLTYTNVTEKNIQIVVMITTIISSFISGFVCSRGAKHKGLIYGGVAGLVYAIIMIIISLCVLPTVSFNSKAIVTLILAVASGGMGGIIGINLKK